MSHISIGEASAMLACCEKMYVRADEASHCDYAFSRILEPFVAETAINGQLINDANRHPDTPLYGANG